MHEHRVQLRVEDWDDVAFREAVDAAWARILLGPDDADSTAAAAHLQLLLRDAGYPGAMVEMHRTVDEALHHVAHFDVSREDRVAVRIPAGG
jgi:hypothetical protein